MIRARRLLEAARRSQQLAVAHGAARFTAPPLAALRQPQLRPHAPLQLARWQSTSAAASEELRTFRGELDGCCDTGNWRQALKVLDRIDKRGYPLDEHMYERAIGACARMGKVEVLPGLLQNMQVDSILPTSATVDYIMQAYLAREEWKLIVELALDVTHKGVPLSAAAYHAAMEACGQARDASSVKKVFSNMWSQCGVSVDASQYAATIRAAGMGGRPDIAVNIFNIMEAKAGLAAAEGAFNQLIRAQIVNGALPQALHTFATAHARGVVMDESIYTATINALVTNEDYWHAGRLFEQMVARGVTPSAFCFGRVMLAYVRTSKNSAALACWREIVDRREPAPALKRYSRLVQELAATSSSNLTVAVFEHMRALFDATEIRDPTYALAIRAYGRLGRTQAAVDLFDAFVARRAADAQPLPRTAPLYLAIFNALSRDSERDPAENTRDAKRVWAVMRANVPVILPPAYASLAGVFAASGELGLVESLLDQARAPGRAGGGIDMSALELAVEDDNDDNDSEAEIAALLAKHAHEANDVDDMSDLHDQILFSGVISGFSKARADHSAHITAYLQLMKARGLPITDSILRASTYAFVKFRQWPLMNALVDYVDLPALGASAGLCFGDTISKLLEAEAWESARVWIAAAHQRGVHAPIRDKIAVLQRLRELGSDEWRVAYPLALETLSFKQLSDQNVESVADAIAVCTTAGRADLALKLYDRVVSHPSRLERADADNSAAVLPLRMYKDAVLALLREPTPDAESFERNIRRAEAECAQMLQQHSKALDGEALSMAISIKATMGDDDDVMALFETTQRLGLEPNTYAQNAALAAFARARRPDKVGEIRDALLAAAAADPAFVPEPNVVKSLLFSLAILHNTTTELVATAAALPACSREHAVRALLQANRMDNAVEIFDETVPLKMFATLVGRICDARPGRRECDPLAAAALVLKYARFHGLAAIRPTSLVLKVAKALVAHGHLPEAGHLLGLYADPDGDVLLKDLKPFFQQEVMEMLLFIYGEQRQFGPLGQLFERPILAFPLNVRHYELAMEYAVQSASPVAGVKRPKGKAAMRALEIEGAAQCLKLFEALRQQFVKPNGAVYVSALRACAKLKLLESTGQHVLEDARAQGFEDLVRTELAALATGALAERETELDSVSERESEIETETETVTESDSGQAAAASGFSERECRANGAELAQVALFCHRNGLAMSPAVATKLLALQARLTKKATKELEFIAQGRADGPAEPAAAAPSARKRAARRPSSAGAGARWGDLFLEPLAADDK
ncbi:hypothetical protein PybrP1_004817 [[Pythium] brassicae (nom. inval.)]|nr:hypothetical protein PybrP1_004817 [[Pythium] brassicae (nom. inval.)]